MAVLQLGALIGMAVVLIHRLRVQQTMDGERLPRSVVIFVAWMGWMGLTMLWSVLPQLSLVGNFYWQLGCSQNKFGQSRLSHFHSGTSTAHSDSLYRIFIIASLPAVIYGLIQLFRLDPIGWWSMNNVVYSTFGNPNYFAGYLIMVMPSTLIESLRSQVRPW